jgi:N-acetylmuramoyl-L-alanine amidase
MMDSNARPPLRDNRPVRVNMLQHLWFVISVGAVLATLFTAWTPLGLMPLGLKERIVGFFSPPDSSLAGLPTPTARPRPRIGIVAGHYKADTGFVCADGLQEVDVNLDIATRVKERLSGEGYEVELLDEYDDRLTNFTGLALVSIHADSCDFIDNESTGFKVSASLGSQLPDKANRLVACLTNRYQGVTGMKYRSGSVTPDMTSYHAFHEINPDTVAVIIETGYLNLDRQILTGQPDLIAKGIADGILCYVQNEDLIVPDAP